MVLKLLFTAFVIVAIGALLLTTKSGQKFTGQALDSVKIKVGNFVSGLFSGTFKWELPFGGGRMPSGEQFPIVLSVAKDSFYGQAYIVDNTSLNMEGICSAQIKVGDTMLRTESKQCAIVAEQMKGTFEYSIAGIVSFDGDVGNMVVDGHTYTSSGSRLKTSFEVLPINFILAGVSERKITIPAATGSIGRLNPDGSIKSTEELASEELEISGFVGFIRLEESNINMQGMAVSVQGTGPHSSFSW